jgi:hypothetical protein
MMETSDNKPEKLSSYYKRNAEKLRRRSREEMKRRYLANPDVYRERQRRRYRSLSDEQRAKKQEYMRERAREKARLVDDLRRQIDDLQKSVSATA